MFYQREWHNVPFEELPEISYSTIAGPEFYSRFYHSLLSRPASPSPQWIEQKRKIGRLLATEFLNTRDSSAGLHAFSVGAGLGIVEGELCDHGYTCDALECEQNSLAWLKEHYPKVRVLVGDGRYLPCRSESYDLVFMSGVDYCFDRVQYRQVLNEMRRIVKPDGRVMNVCLSNLSIKGIVRGIAKTMLSPILPFSQDSQSQVLWGYQRTAGEHIKVGREAGLACESVCLIDKHFDVLTRRQEDCLYQSWPTLGECSMLLVFRRT
jgi:SAM-dependent methyltransferase